MPSAIDLVQTLAVWALPVLFAITLHEVAHGWAAFRLGDDTAARAGRLSFNPIRHVDPVGTIAVPIVLLALGGFIFGWAKPVPVSAGRLRSPKRDMALVAAAGPAANFAMALAWAILLKVSLGMPQEGAWLGIRLMSMAGVVINLVLMVLNLLPLPPLDGSRVLSGVLPPAWALKFAKLEPWGLFILVALLASGILGQILRPPLVLSERLLFAMVGLEPALFR